MSSLKEKLVEDMKLAMKEKKEIKVSVLRKVRAAIKQQEIEKRKELSDEEVIEIIFKKIKYYQQKQTDNDHNSKKEINILLNYIPDMDEFDEVENLEQLING
jgi:uncharacterized protein YqeY